jgi:hypothetical protein
MSYPSLAPPLSLPDRIAAIEAVATQLETSTGVQVAGDIGGTVNAPTIISTHLSAPLPLAQGGVAISLAATGGAGFVLKQNSSHVISVAALVAGDIPDISATYQATAGKNVAGASGYSQLVAAPGTASSAGVAGQEAYDSGFYYRCVATNTWVRVAIATF